MPDILDRLIDADRKARKKKQFNFTASEEDLSRIMGLAEKLGISTAQLLRIGVHYVALEYEKRMARRAASKPSSNDSSDEVASTRDVL